MTPAQPEPIRSLDLVEVRNTPPRVDDAPGTTRASFISGDADITVATVSRNPAAPVEAPPYFEATLADAERLLKYAAECGIDVDPKVRHAILEARSRDGWSPDEQTVANLLQALTLLAAQLRPVTAESLRACGDEEVHTVRGYWKVALTLACVIVPFSVASFLTSAVSDAIRKDVATANELAVKLTAQLRPGRLATSPAATAVGGTQSSDVLPDVALVDVVTELQQFAATIRAVDGRARQLRAFVFFAPEDPFADARKSPARTRETFELPAVLTDLQKAAGARIEVFQQVRYFAQTLLDDVSFFYGAIATCILPVLYALLGTCAYLLRSFEDQMKSKTFSPSAANSARFLIAGIGGAVVGLFNNFSITQGASIPPLAIAFLVGYAVDVFFSFLEGLLQAFTKPRSVPAGVSAGGKG
jgi:hypothetical protein